MIIPRFLKKRHIQVVFPVFEEFIHLQHTCCSGLGQDAESQIAMVLPSVCVYVNGNHSGQAGGNVHVGLC